MTYLLQHVNVRYVMGPVVIMWSLICASTAGVTSWQGLIVQRFVFKFTPLHTSLLTGMCRFFLGFTEALVPTAFMITVSGYYTQKEQALRQSWWFSATGWWVLIGGGLNYGFAQIESANLAPWQYIYILAGSLTFLFGIWCFFLPNSPLDAWFLNPEERLIAVERLRRGQTGVRNQKIKPGQIKEAVLDIKVALIAITMASA